ncbi:MAG: hypothetical protein H7177_09150 [Rhizobacter sp.]|nr:hypothetical protein [Bacteriovorax sp.]
MKKFILLLAPFLINTSMANSYCAKYEKPKSYVKVQKSVDEKLEQFANNKTIAASADAVLSKLITAKSPYVTSWYAKNDFKNKTEEQIAHAWRKDFAMNFLLMKYPQDDAKIDNEIEMVIDGLLKENLTPTYQAKMEKLFLTSKKLAIDTVSKMKLKESDVIIKRIESIKLYWPKNLKSSRNNSMPLDLIEWGIAYDPVPNEINIGVGSLAYPNNETYMAVFAHEIGHAFDPCRWGAFFEGPWPFEKVGECLRSDKSVGAKKRDDSKIEEFLKSGKLTPDLATSLRENPTCNKFAYPGKGIQADQLPESFADWFSAETISHAKKMNARKLRLDLCEVKTLNAGSSYPDNQSRQDKIYFANPKIKGMITTLSIEAAENYCSL